MYNLGLIFFQSPFLFTFLLKECFPDSDTLSNNHLYIMFGLSVILTSCLSGFRIFSMFRCGNGSSFLSWKRFYIFWIVAKRVLVNVLCFLYSLINSIGVLWDTAIPQLYFTYISFSFFYGSKVCDGKEIYYFFCVVGLIFFQ